MPIDKTYTGAELVASYDHRHFGGNGGRYVFEKDVTIIERMLGKPKGLVADIPCGTGKFSAYLRVKDWHILGGDVSLAMLKIAETQHGGTPFFQTDIHRLPFRENSLEVMMIIRLFQHIPIQEFRNVLREARRVIRADGCILFDTLRWSPRQVAAEEKDGMHVYSLPTCRDIVQREGLIVESSISTYLFSAIRYRYMPVCVLKGLDHLEKIVRAEWKLRTFWLCRK
jgi:ubiquinone/menaquinone biosynthesis C-methylase UbiE